MSTGKPDGFSDLEWDNAVRAAENAVDSAVQQYRQFKSGASRDSEDGKLDFEGFIDPLVLFKYAEYMHKHRQMADGSLRSSDNWQKGMEFEVYVKSLLRHVMDLWLWHRCKEQARPETGEVPDIEETLGGILFNAMGYWHEALKIS